jgi:hypothetical protein
VYVQTANGASNKLQLEVLPPQVDINNIEISDVSPSGGPVGTELQISGDNFGIVQGNSRVFLEGANDNDRELLIQEWSDNMIRATIPIGATTGTLHVIINGLDVVFGSEIVVALKPEITAVAPSDLRIGKKVEILGKNFGTEPGSIDIGTTNIAGAQITSWSNNKIVINALPAVTVGDINDVPVVVNTSIDIASDPFTAALVSDIIGQVSVDPITGIATKTEFTFTVSAAGADGAVFKYVLTPDVTKPNVTVTSLPNGQTSADPHLSYTYPAAGKYDTSLRIEDVSTGDFLIIAKPNSPTITVGGVNDVVIVDFGPLDFAQGSKLWENIYTGIEPTPGQFIYNDFLYTPQLNEPQRLWFNTGVDNISFQGNNVNYEREQGDFLYGGSRQRPYGYRRYTNGASDVGGRVRVYGYNFGVTGEIRLNATSFGTNDLIVPDSNIVAWNVDIDGNPADPSEAGYIDFVMPTGQKAASGKFLVANDALLDNTVSPTVGFGVSAQPLVASAFITSTAPNPVSLAAPDTSPLVIQGFDFSAPAVPSVTGSQTYVVWIVNANYNDPFNGDAPTTNVALLMNPLPVSVINGTRIEFLMSSLPQGANNAQIEVTDPTGTQFQPVSGTLTPGPYSYFLWVGVLPTNGTVAGQTLANSGIMSGLKTVDVIP